MGIGACSCFCSCFRCLRRATSGCRCCGNLRRFTVTLQTVLAIGSLALFILAALGCMENETVVKGASWFTLERISAQDFDESFALSGEDIYFDGIFYNFSFSERAARESQNVTLYANLWGICADGVNKTYVEAGSGSGSGDGHGEVKGTPTGVDCTAWGDLSQLDKYGIGCSANDGCDACADQFYIAVAFLTCAMVASLVKCLLNVCKSSRWTSERDSCCRKLLGISLTLTAALSGACNMIQYHFWCFEEANALPFWNASTSKGIWAVLIASLLQIIMLVFELALPLPDGNQEPFSKKFSKPRSPKHRTARVSDSSVSSSVPSSLNNTVNVSFLGSAGSTGGMLRDDPPGPSVEMPRTATRSFDEVYSSSASSKTYSGTYQSQASERPNPFLDGMTGSRTRSSRTDFI